MQAGSELADRALRGDSAQESRCKLRKWKKRGKNDKRRGLAEMPAALTRRQTGVKLATPTHEELMRGEGGWRFSFSLELRVDLEVFWLRGSSRCQDTEFTTARRRRPAAPSELILEITSLCYWPKRLSD